MERSGATGGGRNRLSVDTWLARPALPARPHALAAYEPVELVGQRDVAARTAIDTVRRMVDAADAVGPGRTAADELVVAVSRSRM